jgi:hypothetical protein
VKVATLSLLLPIFALAQPFVTTSGPCSPVAPNNSGSITINCQGISSKLGAQLVDLLNRVAKNQIDAEAMMEKLDGCLQGVKDVREQQSAWRLTDPQREKLRSALAGSHAKAEVRSIPNDRNAALFGSDLYTFLKVVGWDMGSDPMHSGPIIDYGLNPEIEGVVIVVNHGVFPEAALLQNALSAAVGLQKKGEIDQKRAQDLIVIIVGAKPTR